VLRLAILSTITACGFVRDARRVAVRYVVADCCLRFAGGVCRGVVGYTVNHCCF
jgi:hypothetical protein